METLEKILSIIKMYLIYCVYVVIHLLFEFKKKEAKQNNYRLYDNFVFFISIFLPEKNKNIKFKSIKLKEKILIIKIIVFLCYCLKVQFFKLEQIK